MTDFPLDDATLVMLDAACKLNPDTGRTHLHDFLDMGSRIKSQTLVDGDEDADSLADAPVYFVEYEDGCAPWSEHGVIRALIAEIFRLREGQ